MTKILTLLLALVCSAAMLAEPLSSQSIVVTPENARAQFVERVSQDLDHQLLRASRWGDDYGEGIAVVRFTRGADGEPENVRLYRKTGTYGLDRTAVRAVNRLDSIKTVPAGIADDQVYQANIIFANNDRSLVRLSDKLDAEEAARLAMGGNERRVLAFGYVALTPAS
ncbi:energy transducer TonB [Qipengyuania sp. 1NDH17]|uniref:Energy transducer TonB n=1 Tax=Qipengyuania polymorpha TaxID=2867234 RepID=A0ABS7J549_9SPHN|nr:energy transducer TonB [Qipengyuania polymorpha]MBX7458543.1 energy transducer TonB [Qipengyuania polymorpha]